MRSPEDAACRLSFPNNPSHSRRAKCKVLQGQPGGILEETSEEPLNWLSLLKTRSALSQSSCHELSNSDSATDRMIRRRNIGTSIPQKWNSVPEYKPIGSSVRIYRPDEVISRHKRRNTSF